MPNWCLNSVTFTHTDPAQIARIVKGYGGEGLMGEFHPTPAELMDERTSTHGGDKAAEYNALRAAMVEKHGYSGWYDWRVANWGTKWDVSGEAEEVGIGDDGLMAEFSFDSAWGPPLEFYTKMEELGFTVDAYYYEPGMAFCGHWSNGSDNQYQIKGDANWVVENIPKDIEERFDIADSVWDHDNESIDD